MKWGEAEGEKKTKNNNKSKPTITNQNQQQQKNKKQQQNKQTKNNNKKNNKKNWRQEEGMKRGKNRGGKTKTTTNENHNKTTGAGIVRWDTRCRPANCLFVRVTPLRTTPPGSPAPLLPARQHHLGALLPYCQQGDTTWEPCSPIARKPDFPGPTTP